MEGERLHDDVADHAYAVEIKQLKESDIALERRVNRGFDEVKADFQMLRAELQRIARFPVATVLMLVFGIFGIGASLMTGFVGIPMSEVKSHVEYINKQRDEELYQKGVHHERINRLSDYVYNTLAPAFEAHDDGHPSRVEDVKDVQYESLKALLESRTEDRYPGARGELNEQRLDTIEKWLLERGSKQ